MLSKFPIVKLGYLFTASITPLVVSIPKSTITS